MSGTAGDAQTEELRMPVLRRPGTRPFPPRVSSFTRPFWDALVQGGLTTTACSACGRLSFPPKPLCRSCWSEKMVWRALKPSGVLYSCTHVLVVPGAFVNDAPDGLGIGIVDLDDGVRLMCRLLGAPSLFRPETPVEMIVLQYDDGPLFAARLCDALAMPAPTAPAPATHAKGPPP